MTKKIKISVIVPIYNVEKYLVRCIESLLNQTFNYFEVLLIDDGSIDNSSEICKKFCTRDTRIKYFYKKNGGLSDARNYGIERSNGNYLIFVDSDDYVDRNYLLYLYKAVEEKDADIAICSFKNVNEQGKVLSVTNVSANSVMSGRKLLANYLSGKDNISDEVAWNKIYKRKIFKKLRYPKGHIYEDEAIITQILWNVKKVAFVEQSLYYYVQRGGSITSSSYNYYKLKDMFLFSDDRVDFFRNRNQFFYKLAIQKYKDNLVFISSKYLNTLSSKSTQEIQKKYRELVKLHLSVKPKSFIRDTIAFINIKIIAKLKNKMN